MPRVQEVQLLNPDAYNLEISIQSRGHDERSAERRIQEYTAQLQGIQERIQADQDKIQALDPGAIITLEHMKEILGRNPCIDPRSVGILLRPNGDKILRWVFHDIKCTPDENPYEHQITEPAFMLDKAVVEVNLEQYTIKIKPMSNRRRLCPKGYSNSKVVHPHVLSKDSPCLGDFSDNVVMSVQELDFDTLGTVIQLFLEQAVNSDGAGKHWPKFIFNHINTHSYSNIRVGNFSVFAKQSHERVQGRLRHVLTMPIQGEDCIFKGTEEQAIEFLRTYEPLEVLYPGTAPDISENQEVINRYLDLLNPSPEPTITATAPQPPDLFDTRYAMPPTITMTRPDTTTW